MSGESYLLTLVNELQACGCADNQCEKCERTQASILRVIKGIDCPVCGSLLSIGDHTKVLVTTEYLL